MVEKSNPDGEANSDQTWFNRRGILQALGAGGSLSVLPELARANLAASFDAIFLQEPEDVISAPFTIISLVDSHIEEDTDCLGSPLSKYEIRHHDDAQTEVEILVDKNLEMSVFSVYKVASFNNQVTCRGFSPTAFVNVDRVEAGSTPPEQFDGVYDEKPVKQTPFTIPSDHGVAENVNFCVAPRGDYRRFRVQHEGEESPSATIFTPVDQAENVDRDAEYKVTDILGESCGNRRFVTCSRVENEPPTAAFTVSPQRPLRGESVTFDASGSSDPDGDITQFDWDFETDGTVDTTGEQVTHTFAEGGDHTVTLRVTDDDGATASTQQTVTVIIPVTIDITPGDEPNPLNPDRRGVLPVAILQTGDFDPQRVDVGSLRFGPPDVVDGGGGASPAHSSVEDVDGDGDTDLSLKFPVQDTGFDGDENSGKLVGQTTGGIPLVGTDSVTIVGG